MIEDEEIRQAGLELEVGDATHMTCPFCRVRHERSMRVSRAAEGLHAKCYRAKCGWYRFIPSIPSMGTAAVERKKKPFKAKAFRYELVNLTPDVQEFLFSSYGLYPDETTGWKYNEERMLLHMPIKDIRGYEVGAQTKYIGAIPTDYPKAVTYMYNDSPIAHFNTTPGADVVILVEDIISATVVHRYADSVALLGTELMPDVAHILAANYKYVIVMLDPDALGKAIKMRNRYKLYFRNFLIRSLSDDPKDVGLDELEEEVLGAINSCGSTP